MRTSWSDEGSLRGPRLVGVEGGLETLRRGGVQRGDESEFTMVNREVL